MKLNNVSCVETMRFPLEAEPFVDFQTEITGRTLSEKEKEVTVVCMQIINCYYDDGKNGEKYEPLYEDADRWFKANGKLKSFIQLQEFFKSVDLWCELAFKRGRESAGLEA